MISLANQRVRALAQLGTAGIDRGKDVQRPVESARDDEEKIKQILTRGFHEEVAGKVLANEHKYTNVGPICTLEK